jgi:aminoglycoside phosphotransferase (APT) family kinase protein
MTSIDRQTAFSGTKDAAAALRLDVARLERYLAAQVTGFSGPLSVKQFKGGQSNPTYLLGTPARRYVLRRKPPGTLLPSAHAVDREYRVIKALHAQGFPAPEPLIYCADDGVVGTPFYVMDFVDGRVFWEPQMPGSNAAERAAVYNSMNETIARLHAFDPIKVGLGDFGKGENYVARQVDRWSKQYRASETEKIESMERLIDWLPKHIPASGPAGAWGLSSRQYDYRRRSTGNCRGARLGIVDARRCACRFQLSPDGVAYAAIRKRGRHGVARRT